MPNSELQGKSYEVDPVHYNQLGTSISYEALKMRGSRMKKAKDTQNTAEFERYGGDETLKYVEGILKQDRNVSHDRKDLGRKTGLKNQFLKTHTKDTDNVNITDIGGEENMNTKGINREILSNSQVQNEGLNKELKDIKYLMEYMNNTKQKI